MKKTSPEQLAEYAQRIVDAIEKVDDGDRLFYQLRPDHTLGLLEQYECAQHVLATFAADDGEECPLGEEFYINGATYRVGICGVNQTGIYVLSLSAELLLIRGNRLITNKQWRSLRALVCPQ